MKKLLDTLLKIEYVLISWLISYSICNFIVVEIYRLASSHVLQDTGYGILYLVVLVLSLILSFFVYKLVNLISDGVVKLWDKVLAKYTLIQSQNDSSAFYCLAVLTIFVFMLWFTQIQQAFLGIRMSIGEFSVIIALLTIAITYYDVVNPHSKFEISEMSKTKNILELGQEQMIGLKGSGEPIVNEASFYIWCTNTSRHIGNIKYVGWCYAQHVDEENDSYSFEDIKQSHVKPGIDWDFVKVNPGEMTPKIKFYRSISGETISGTIYVIFMDSVGQTYKKKITFS